jgi:four helix bundle protein
VNYRGFKDLECWQKARELRNKIRILVRKFPDTEKYKLTPQIKDSTRSVTRNIAEGYGRFTYADTRHFFIQARGSLTESMDHLTVAFDEEYIDNIEYDELDKLCETVF